MSHTPYNPVCEPSDEQIVRELKLASDGLLYPSESDEPFAIYVNSTDDDVLIKLLPETDTKIVQTSVATFFAELIIGENGSKFEQLKRVVESRLLAPKVLRIGQITVDVYVIGRTPSGSWAGLHTVSIET